MRVAVAVVGKSVLKLIVPEISIAFANIFILPAEPIKVIVVSGACPFVSVALSRHLHSGVLATIPPASVIVAYNLISPVSLVFGVYVIRGVAAVEFTSATGPAITNSFVVVLNAVTVADPIPETLKVPNPCVIFIVNVTDVSLSDVVDVIFANPVALPPTV